MPANLCIVIGALLAALAVGLGAIGAHALKDTLDSQHMEVFRTAAQYHLIHSLGLILVGLLATHRPSRLFDLAAVLMMVGVVFFSGFLYAYATTQVKALALPVPIGGLSFIAAWLAVAAGAIGFR